MKKLLFILFCFSFLHLHAQSTSDEFIEVSVTDTVEADAEEIIYCIYFYLSEEEGSSMTNNLKVTSGYDSSYQKVYTLIKKMRIDTLENFSNLNPSDDNKRKVFLRFTSESTFNEFRKKITSFKNIQAIITNKKTSKIKAVENILFNKLYVNAEEQAVFFAKRANKSISGILQIKVDDSDEQGSWTAYPPLSSFLSAENKANDTKIIFSKKITVRYSWK